MSDRRFSTGSRRDAADDKAPLTNLAWEAIEDVSKIHEFGDHHYGKGNWRKGQPVTELLNSAMRHLSAFLRGEDRDPKSGKCHLSHAAWNILVALRQWLLKGRYRALDDRMGPDGEWVSAEYAATPEAAECLLSATDRAAAIELERGDL